jgi:signal transduction histidine kinase
MADIDPSRLPVLYDVIRLLSSSLNVNDVLKQVFTSIRQLIDVERIAVRLESDYAWALRFDPQPEVLRYVQGHAAESIFALIFGAMSSDQGVLISESQVNLQIPQDWINQVVARRYLERLGAIQPLQPTFEIENDELLSLTIMTTRLKSRDKVVGALYVDRNAGRGSFTADDSEMLMAFAEHAARAIFNAQAYEKAQRLTLENASVMRSELIMPITSIRGYAQLLLTVHTETLNGEQKHWLEIIYKEVGRIRALIDVYADMAEIESGQLRSVVSIGAIKLEDCVKKTLDDLRSQAEARKQSITVEIGQVPAVRANEWRLIEVIRGLLDNALKFSPDGAHVAVIATSLGATVKLTVSDTGIGISQEMQPHVFAKFFRGDHPVVRESEGLGLGLYFAKHWIEALGGEIGMESEPGKGSTFWFTLPIATTEDNSPSDG